MKKIAIQGVPGSYHDIAAHKFFKNEEIELICCNTFEEVFDTLKKDSSIIGMIAIENTIAGSLLHYGCPETVELRLSENINYESATASCVYLEKTGVH